MKVKISAVITLSTLFLFMAPLKSYAWVALECEKTCVFPCSSIDSPIKWNTDPSFEVDGGLGTASGCSEFQAINLRNSFNCAVEAWEDLGSSNRSMSVSNGSGFNIGASGGNQVALTSASRFSGGTIAMTWVGWNCNCCQTVRMTYADIEFSNGVSWSSSSPYPGSSAYNTSTVVNFKSVALHEVGHAMGLSNTPSGSSANNHEDDVACNMNTMYPDGGWYAGDDFSFDGETFFHGRIWPHADDAQGMNFLYPSSNTGRDLAVSRSKKGTSPVGSAVDLDSVTPNPACPGDLITTEYTVENRGNETIVSAIAEVYLSTNNTISSSDTYLGGYAETMTAFTEITRTRTYTIPSGMAAGDYYVGVYFDPDDVFTGEQSSIWNNRIYLPVENSSSDQLTILSSTHPSCL